MFLRGVSCFFAPAPWSRRHLSAAVHKQMQGPGGSPPIHVAPFIGGDVEELSAGRKEFPHWVVSDLEAAGTTSIGQEFASLCSVDV
jgi:hypothetical protein